LEVFLLTNKVAVQKNLIHVAKGLRDFGYEVEEFEREYRGDAQTIIYSAYKGGSQAINDFECVTNNFTTKQSQGVLMVNGDDKDSREIDYVIKNRIYSPLF